MLMSVDGELAEGPLAAEDLLGQGALVAGALGLVALDALLGQEPAAVRLDLLAPLVWGGKKG